MRRLHVDGLVIPFLLLCGAWGSGCGTSTVSPSEDTSAEVREPVDAPAADLPAPPEIVPEFLPAPPPGMDWALLFNDEFTGDALDETVWNYGTGPRRQGVWTPDAVSLDGDGHLVMEIYEEDGVHYDGEIDTMGTFDVTFGYFEARVQLHTEEGHWPAFWLMPYTFGDVPGTGADGAEVDIFEKPWINGVMADVTNHALHWDSYAEGAELSKTIETPGIREGWHVYSLWWTPEEYIFYIDGVEIWRTEGGGVCQEPLYLLLSDEIDNSVWFLGGDIVNATLPDHWLVDYVRVWELVD